MTILLKSMAIGFTLITGLQAKDAPEIKLDNCPNEIHTSLILSYAPTCQILELGSEVSFNAINDFFGNLRLVCKNWEISIDKEIDPNKVPLISDYTWKEKKKSFFINAIISTYKRIGHGEDCGLFLNGKLFYTPDKGDPIPLLIADLEKPFAGEFDLLNCGDVGKHLSISTGYRKKKLPQNGKKVEVWFVPWFVVNRDLGGPASLFNSIFNFWDGTVAPVGIVWTGGWWDNLRDYWYLVDKDINFISSANLYALSALISNNNSMHRAVNLRIALLTEQNSLRPAESRKFHVCFKQESV